MSKLQTKVESLETVKEVQDKIISAKDSQISFLNDQIANIWTPITIVAGLIALVVTYVAWVNKKADEKIEQGAKQIVEAEKKIQQANNIATVAQKKLDELESRQNELNDLANTTIKNQKIDMSIRKISITLDRSKDIIDKILTNCDLVESFKIDQKQKEKLFELNKRHASIIKLHNILLSNFSLDVTKGIQNNIDEITMGADRLQSKSYDLYKECIDLKKELSLHS